MLNYLLTNWMDTLGVILGLLYLWLEIKEKALMWLVGCIMPIIYIFVLYKAGIYGDCGLEVYYFLAGLYGLYFWLKKNKAGRKEEDTLNEKQQKEENGQTIKRTPIRLALQLAIIALFPGVPWEYSFRNAPTAKCPG